MAVSPHKLFLLADIGGTHTRLSLLEANGQFIAPKVLENARFPDLGALLASYLESLAPDRLPAAGAFAVACPVEGDCIRLTNLGWEFSADKLRRCLGLSELQIINDFTAIALAIPELEAQATVKIGTGTPQRRAPIGVIGPGTGLGVSGLVPCGNGWVALASEGGHVTMAPASEEEARVLDQLRRHLEHVSAEKVLSGSGLINLYQCLKEMSGQVASPLTSQEVTERAMRHQDPWAVQALEMYFSLLGTAAGNLALILGARGGIYLAGGILPRMVEPLKASRFRARFVDKGRFRPYLEAIPTYLIVHPLPALAGLRVYLQSTQRLHPCR